MRAIAMAAFAVRTIAMGASPERTVARGTFVEAIAAEGIWRRAGIRHRDPQEYDRRRAGSGEKKERHRVTELIADPSCDARAERGADTRRQSERTDGQIQVAGAPRHVGGDERQHHSEDRRADAVQGLEDGQRQRARQHREQQGTHRHGSKTGQQHRSSPHALRERAGPRRNHRRDDLRHHDRR
jgi:hypothetical protein